MKILQINAVYGVGSTGVIVKELHELSLNNGIESHVAFSTSKMPVAEIKNGYKIGTAWGKKLHAVLGRINGKQAYFSRFSTHKLIHHIRRIKPDIVHLHNLHSNYIHLNMLLKFLAKEKIKTVVTLHDCWFFTGGCYYYTEANCDRWMFGCGSCPKKRQDSPAYLLDCSSKIWTDRRKYLGKIDDLTLVGVSRWITAEAERSGLQAKRFVTVYNGIDTDFFRPTSSGLRKDLGLENKFVVLGMANKWLKPINTATLRVVSEGLGEDSALLIVGCSEDVQKKTPSNVIMYGYIHDRNQLRKIYSMADVFANCTREDALSLVSVEAQSCGTPIVTYRNTGVQETVDDISSFAVENGEPQALLAKIYEIKQNGKQLYAHACREQACLKFDRDTNYQEYLNLYKTI